MSPKKEDPLESYGKRVFVYLIILLFDFFNSHASPSNQLWGEDMYLLIASIFTFSINMSTSARFLILLIIAHTSFSVISEPGAYHQTAVRTFSYLKNHSVDILQTSLSHIFSSFYLCSLLRISDWSSGCSTRCPFRSRSTCQLLWNSSSLS